MGDDGPPAQGASGWLGRHGTRRCGYPVSFKQSKSFQTTLLVCGYILILRSNSLFLSYVAHLTKRWEWAQSSRERALADQSMPSNSSGTGFCRPCNEAQRETVLTDVRGTSQVDFINGPASKEASIWGRNLSLLLAYFAKIWVSIKSVLVISKLL